MATFGKKNKKTFLFCLILHDTTSISANCSSFLRMIIKESDLEFNFFSFLEKKI